MESSSATWRSTAGCAGRSEMEEELRSARRISPKQPRLARPRGPARRRGDAGRRGGARRPDRPAHRAAATGWSARSRPRPCRGRATRPRSRSSRRRAPSRRSGRSPRSRAPASASRSRCATRRRPWSGPATTRPTPGRGSRRTASMPSRSPARPSAWRCGASSSRRSSAARASTRRTLAAIERAEQATMKTATRYLEKRMVGDLARVTDGRYRRVRVDDKTLDIGVHAPEKRRLGQGLGAQPGHARPRLPRPRASAWSGS